MTVKRQLWPDVLNCCSSLAEASGHATLPKPCRLRICDSPLQRVWGRSDSYEQGWPEPYECTVYDCIFGDFPAKNTVYTGGVYNFYMVLANPTYEQLQHFGCKAPYYLEHLYKIEPSFQYTCTVSQKGIGEVQKDSTLHLWALTAQQGT